MRIPLAVLPVSGAENLLPIFVTVPNLFVCHAALVRSGVNYPVMRRLNITYGGQLVLPPTLHSTFPLRLAATFLLCLYSEWATGLYLERLLNGVQGERQIL